MSQIENKLDALKSKFYQIQGHKTSLERQKIDIEKDIVELKDIIDVLKKCVAVFDKLLDVSLKDKIEKIDNLVTYGLKTVIHDQDLKFKSVSSQKRDKLWIDLHTIKDGTIEGSALDMSGGGVVVIESYILRMLVLVQEKLKRFAFLDEPFKQVSTEYIPAVSKLCKELCDKLKIDLLIVSHSEELLEHADHIYRAYETKNGLKLKKEK